MHSVLKHVTRTSFGAHHKNLNKDRPILSATKITLDSGNIKFMRILAVLLEIYVNFPYIYVCLCPYIQVWYAVLVVKVIPNIAVCVYVRVF